MTESLNYRILTQVRREYRTVATIAPVLREEEFIVLKAVRIMCRFDWDKLSSSARGRPWLQSSGTGYLSLTARGRKVLEDAGNNVHLDRTEERRFTVDRQAGWKGSKPAPRGENAVVSSVNTVPHCLDPESKARRQSFRPDEPDGASLTFLEGFKECPLCSKKRGKSVYKPLDRFSPKGNGLHSYCKVCRNEKARKAK